MPRLTTWESWCGWLGLHSPGHASFRRLVLSPSALALEDVRSCASSSGNVKVTVSGVPAAMCGWFDGGNDEG